MKTKVVRHNANGTTTKIGRYYVVRGPFDTDLEGKPEWVVRDALGTPDGLYDEQVAGGFKSKSHAQRWCDEHNA